MEDQKNSTIDSSKIEESKFQKSFQKYRDSTKRNNPDNSIKNGTDLALRKISLEVEQQLYGILWNIVFTTADTDDSTGPNAAKLLMPELIAQIVTDISGDELGEIAESIYDHLKREQEGR